VSGPRRYFPGCRAILQVVLDDFGAIGSADGEDHEDGGDAEVGSAGHPIVIPVMPKTVTIHKNSYRQADSYELTFDAGDLPFDPRIIRAGESEIFLFQTDGLNPTGRVLSRKDSLSDPDPRAQAQRDPMDTLALELDARAAKDKFTYKNKPNIAGLWDRSDLDLSSDGKWVTINGQDYTGMLAAEQWKPNADGTARRIPIGKRVDLLLADVLAEADPTGKLAIEVRDLDPETLPIVGANEVRGSARGIPVEQKTSYWDVIYNVATRVGLIAFVDGVDVVLTRPKTITANDGGKIKRLAWGHNLEHLKLEREYGKEQAPTIVMRGYDPVARKTIEVKYPTGQVDFGKRKPHVNEVKVRGTQTRAKTTEKHRTHPPSKKKKTVTTIHERDEYQIIPMYGISDRATLLRAAQNRYQMIGRAERRVIASTRDLKDMRESDMLGITAGDAVLIDWDEFNREMLQNPGVSEAEKVEHLVVRGFNREVARVIARRFDALVGLDRPLRVKEATLSWDVEDGINIEVELYDFIMVDGIRPDDGAPAPTRADRRNFHDNNGKPIGWSNDRREDLKRRHRQ
jgi:hypothetical protein